MKLELKGKRILLRPTRISDAEDIYRNIKHQDISKWTTNIPYPYKKKDALAYIRQCKRNLKTKKELNFSVTHQKIGTVIGGIGFVKIDRKNN